MKSYKTYIELADERLIKLSYILSGSHVIECNPKQKFSSETIDALEKRMYFSNQIVAEDLYGREIGSCWFHFFDRPKRYCELYGIEINDENYIDSGVGTAMIKELEKIALQKRCRLITGTFIPYGRFSQYSKNFYLRNGYKITYNRQKMKNIFEKELQSPLLKGNNQNVASLPQFGE